MAFRPKFFTGATIQDIRLAMNPTPYIKSESEIDGIRWIKITSDHIVQNHECDPKIYIPDEQPTGDSTLPGANNEHSIQSNQ